MTVFWIWLLSTTCNTQYTTITDVWNDDYIATSSEATPGWEYHDGGIIDGSYHGYYLGVGGGVSGPSVSLRENYEIERMFYCATYNSSVDITYTVYYCNCDNTVNDYVELSVNDNTAQTTDASAGIFIGSAIDGLSNTCNWYSKSSEIISIPLVILNHLFKIHFKISLNYQGETIVLSNIQIICHPLTPSPMTNTFDPTYYPLSSTAAAGKADCKLVDEYYKISYNVTLTVDETKETNILYLELNSDRENKFGNLIKNMTIKEVSKYEKEDCMVSNIYEDWTLSVTSLSRIDSDILFQSHISGVNGYYVETTKNYINSSVCPAQYERLFFEEYNVPVSNVRIN
eukprot:88395_1